MNEEDKYAPGTLVKTTSSPYRIYMIIRCEKNWFPAGSGHLYTCQGIANEEKKDVFYWQSISGDALERNYTILKGKR